MFYFTWLSLLFWLVLGSGAVNWSEWCDSEVSLWTELSTGHMLLPSHSIHCPRVPDYVLDSTCAPLFLPQFISMFMPLCSDFSLNESISCFALSSPLSISVIYESFPDTSIFRMESIMPAEMVYARLKNGSGGSRVRCQSTINVSHDQQPRSASGFL